MFEFLSIFVLILILVSIGLLVWAVIASSDDIYAGAAAVAIIVLILLIPQVIDWIATNEVGAFWRGMRSITDWWRIWINYPLLVIGILIAAAGIYFSVSKKYNVLTIRNIPIQTATDAHPGTFQARFFFFFLIALVLFIALLTWNIIKNVKPKTADYLIELGEVTEEERYPGFEASHRGHFTITVPAYLLVEQFNTYGIDDAIDWRKKLQPIIDGITPNKTVVEVVQVTFGAPEHDRITYAIVAYVERDEKTKKEEIQTITVNIDLKGTDKQWAKEAKQRWTARIRNKHVHKPTSRETIEKPGPTVPRPTITP